jgi:hypothetical protein
MFTKTMEEESAMLKNISHQLENLNRKIYGLQVKILNDETSISLINKMAVKPVTMDENPFATANAIQVRIDVNVRMFAELHPRWERGDEITRNNNMTNVCTITTTSSNKVSNSSQPPTINGKIIGVGKVPASSTKLPRITETVSDKCAEIFQSMGGNSTLTFDNNDFDFHDCNI